MPFEGFHRAKMVLWSVWVCCHGNCFCVQTS